MPESIETRVGVLSQRVVDLVDDIDELKTAVKGYHHRLRAVESAVALLVEAQKDARRAESAQYRRLELRLQWLAVAVAFAGVIVSIVLVVIHH